jgi:lysophospholipase L1-like esterase
MTASKHKRSSFYAACILAGLMLLVAVAAGAELGYRALKNGTFYLPPGTWASDPDLIYKLEPENPETPQSFRLKAPGPKTGGRLRIVCLGGSTTYGHGVRGIEAWPAVLEDILRRRGIPSEVINAGVPGYGSRQILMRYHRDIARLTPDIVLFYEGWNRTGALIDRAGWLPYAIPSPNAGFPERAGRWLAKHSLILQAYVTRSFARRQKVPPEKWSADPYPDVFASDVQALVQDILANGQKAAVIVYPALYFAGMSNSDATSYASLIWDCQSYRPEMLLELERKHSALRQIAASTGAALIDAQRRLDGLDGAARRALFLDSEHLSVTGNQKMAEIVADSLAELQSTPPAAKRSLDN